MGADERALGILQRALQIREEILGPQHPNVAVTLNALAASYEDLRDYGHALPMYQRALELRERALGPKHYDVAIALNNLGQLYAKLGDAEKARPLLERSLHIREEVLGRDHPAVANALTGLARVLASGGQFDEAERLLDRALRLTERALGPWSPELAKMLDLLGQVYAARNRPTAAPTFERVLAITEHILRHSRVGADEGYLEDFLRAEQQRNDHIYSLVLRYPGDARARRLALTTALLRKGRLLSEAQLLARTVRASLKTPEDEERLTRLLVLRRRLASLQLQTARPNPDKGKDAPRPEVATAQLEEEAEAIEDQLARRSAALRLERSLPDPPVLIERIRRALPARTALLEMVLFHPQPSGALLGDERSLPEHYLGFVLRATGEVLATDLGEASPIDDAASALRQALSKAGSAPDAGQRLGRLLMAKLGPLLADSTGIYVSPDGALDLVPFVALDDGRGALLDRYHITYLTSGLDLLHEGTTAPARSVVVFADPDFHADTTPVPQASKLRSPDETRSGERTWLRLLGTRREAEAIHGLLPQAMLFLGKDASKTALLGVASPGILHIATHGWLLDDGARSDQLVTKNPLLRSGLVLAGANRAGDTGAQGLVTALEMAGMDLRGTQLVVLSACDTGLGMVKRGEGVYGLGRALLIAGAETLVMSLWTVDDQSTRALMVKYYERLLAGSGRGEAMEQAMKEVRAVHPDPTFWAPFFVLGDPKPLRGVVPQR
jgi:CHAT domain-containing protein/Tfp pilus assembly protein PilF